MDISRQDPEAVPEPRVRRLVRGHLVASLLRQSAAPGPARGSLDGALIAALRLGGVLALAGDRPDRVPAATSDDPIRIEQRRLALFAALQGHHLATLLPALRAAGVEPILLKGLASARNYPSPELRPCLGDIDLLVSEDRMQRAAGVLASQGFALHRDRPSHGRPPVILATRGSLCLDLQSSLWPLPATEARDAHLRRETAIIEGLPVGVLPRATEVRFLAAHAAKHAFARPIWLCDLVAAVESTPLLDWEALLSGPRLVRSWIAAALDLAAGLLGLALPAEVDRRIAGRGVWLADEVLVAWGRTSPTAGIARPLHLLRALRRRDVAGVAGAIRHAWPGPGESLAALGWPFEALLGPAAVVALAGHRSWQFARRRHIYHSGAAQIARRPVAEGV